MHVQACTLCLPAAGRLLLSETFSVADKAPDLTYPQLRPSHSVLPQYVWMQLRELLRSSLGKPPYDARAAVDVTAVHGGEQHLQLLHLLEPPRAGHREAAVAECVNSGIALVTGYLAGIRRYLAERAVHCGALSGHVPRDVRLRLPG